MRVFNSVKNFKDHKNVSFYVITTKKTEFEFENKNDIECSQFVLTHCILTSKCNCKYK